MSFDYNDTYAEVVNLIADQLGINKNEINDDSTLENLGADSLDRVEIVMKIEEKFGIEINDEDAEKKLHSIKDVVNYVNSLRK